MFHRHIKLKLPSCSGAHQAWPLSQASAWNALPPTPAWVLPSPLQIFAYASTSEQSFLWSTHVNVRVPELRALPCWPPLPFSSMYLLAPNILKIIFMYLLHGVYCLSKLLWTRSVCDFRFGNICIHINETSWGWKSKNNKVHLFHIYLHIKICLIIYA